MKTDRMIKNFYSSHALIRLFVVFSCAVLLFGSAGELLAWGGNDDQKGKQPSVSITSPSNGETFSVGETVTVSAEVSNIDSDDISKIEFFCDGESIESGTSYSTTWTPSAVGSYTFTVTVSYTKGDGGNHGNKTETITSDGVTIVVGSDVCSSGAVEWVQYTGYSEGDIVLYDGHQWQAGKNIYGNDTSYAPGTKPRNDPWVDLGACSTSNEDPTVTLTSPATSYPVGTDVSLQTTASDADGNLASLEITCSDGSSWTYTYASQSSATETATWDTDALASGVTYTCTATATDSLNATGSDTIEITLTSPSNIAPTVNITSPATGAAYSSGATVTLSAEATDGDGTISSVVFYYEGSTTPIGTGGVESGTHTYTLDWTEVTAGTYVITAVATDNEGATTTSASITITVGGGNSDDTGEFSQTPLEASLSAAPANVMFLMDDSGSMLFDIMSSMEEGGIGGSSGGSAFCLFPGGCQNWYGGGYSVSGDNLLWWKTQWNGFNKIYYNPATTYEPWPNWTTLTVVEKDSDGSTPTLNASLTTPRLDPVENDTLNIFGSFYNGNSNYGSSSSSGIQIPYAHYYMVNDANGNGSPDSGEVYLIKFTYDSSSGSYAREYYSVTYTAASYNQDKVTALTAVDDANVPDSIRAYTEDGDGNITYLTDLEDLQNFANWFQFYRTRELTAKAAVDLAMQGLSNINLGFYGINFYNPSSSNSWKRNNTLSYPVTSIGTEANKEALLNAVFYNKSAGGTPLRTGLATVGDYFDQETTSSRYSSNNISYNSTTDPKNGKWGGLIGANPYYSSDDGGQCQHSFAIVMTDGFWGGYTAQKYSGSGYTDFDNEDGSAGSPYADSYETTLADIAYYFYQKDLSSTLSDSVPTSEYDKNTQQHMITYSVSFGVEGTIDQSPYEDDPYFLEEYPLSDGTAYPTWPDPWNDAENSKIDDLWHAAVNGRGLFFSASDPESLVDSLTDMFTSIENRNGSGAAAAANAMQLTTDTYLFVSSYNTGNWTGDLGAYQIDSISGDVADTATWTSQTLLDAQNWDTGRLIVTYNPTGGEYSRGVPFRPDSDGTVSVSAGEVAALQADGDDADDVINYLRGESIDGFRERAFVLGDLVHSTPLYVETDNTTTDGFDNDGDGETDESGEKGGTVYVGGNDGMLHAFNAQTGRERFAYVPLRSFEYLTELTKTDYDHRFYVDGNMYSEEMSFLIGDQSSDYIDNDGDGYKDDDSHEEDDGYSEVYGSADDTGKRTSKNLLVGAFGLGGRGVYGLDVTDAEEFNGGLSGKTEAEAAGMVLWEYPSPAESADVSWVSAAADGNDNDADGIVDDDGEMWLIDSNAVTDASAAASDGLDNDGDGIVDNSGETYVRSGDDDMGYYYGTPYLVKSYKSTYPGYVIPSSASYDSTTSMPWIVVFGNGYKSINGHAVLYILDAFSGKLLRKIDTGVGSSASPNGLSSPAIVDVDSDGRVDYAYAGDLQGNMWKFDLTDSDPANWGVFYGADAANPTDSDRTIARIDAADGDTPKPLITIPDQPITSEPDVMVHPSGTGYLVEFGTGKYLGENDRSDTSQQSVFGIWDYGTAPDQYLGTWTRSTDTNTLSNLSSSYQLLEQSQLSWISYTADGTTSYYRYITDNTPNWEITDDGALPAAADLEETPAHVGWYFDLAPDDTTNPIDLDGERVAQDVIIRSGRLIVVSFVPDSSACGYGGRSIINEFDADTGGRYSSAIFDVTGNGIVDENDLLTISESEGSEGSGSSGESYVVEVVVSGVLSEANGRVYIGPILEDDSTGDDGNSDSNTEIKYMTSSSGEMPTMREKKQKTGFYYWKEY